MSEGPPGEGWVPPATVGGTWTRLHNGMFETWTKEISCVRPFFGFGSHSTTRSSGAPVTVVITKSGLWGKSNGKDA